uniref:Putative ovule protein n=1 Tax=Solanum chacoense TaxID=4108 RepID=A0A0V0GVJ3_SOLCH
MSAYTLPSPDAACGIILGMLLLLLALLLCSTNDAHKLGDLPQGNKYINCQIKIMSLHRNERVATL